MVNQTFEAVVVGGGGHVGLPLALVLASSGISTVALDIDSEKVNIINNGSMPFLEEGGENLLKDCLKKKKFLASTDTAYLQNAKYVIVVIGTPVDEHLGPNPNSVIDAILKILPSMKNNQVLILRSTLFPGVTRKVEQLIKKSYSETIVSYCPERIIEGKAIEEIRKLPQIIGIRESKDFIEVKKLFDAIGVESIQVTPEEAELAKLFTNVWRYIKFAAANQFWMMANDMRVDYENVRRAISYEYPRASDLPSSGFAAGPCLFKDTMQLSALVQQNFPLGNSAMMINEGTPGYLVGRMKEIFPLSEMTVGILGVAFKGNVDDIRSSLAFKLRKLLMFEAKEVLISDPLVKDSRLSPIENVLEKSDLLVIGSPHNAYKDLEVTKPIVDIWGLRGQGVLI